MKKIILSTITSITVYILSGWLIELILVQFDITAVYLRDALFYLFIPLLAVTIVVYYFRSQKKELAVGFIIGFILYYSFFWIAHLWGMGEALECTNYFFNLMSNCPR